MRVGGKGGWNGSRRGEGERGGQLEGMELSRWRKDRDESKERDILIEGAIVGLARNLALEKHDDPS